MMSDKDVLMVQRREGPKDQRKPESIKRRGRSSNIGAKATIQQVAMKSNEKKVEERKVKVSSLPVHVIVRVGKLCKDPQISLG